jgi:hypothetical protein
VSKCKERADKWCKNGNIIFGFVVLLVLVVAIYAEVTHSSGFGFVVIPMTVVVMLFRFIFWVELRPGIPSIETWGG